VTEQTPGWECVVHTSFSHWNKDVWISSPPLSPSLSLLLGYWSSWALWVQRVKAWKAKQPRFQRSHESLKCPLFQLGPVRHVCWASDPRAHLEIQWLNLAHPTLNQSIPIISYCLPSATGPDEPERERKYLLKAYKWKDIVCVFGRWRVYLWACVTLAMVGIWKHFQSIIMYVFIQVCWMYKYK